MVDKLETEIGNFYIECNDEYILSGFFSDDKIENISENSISKEAKIQLNEYFNLKRKKFDLPIFLNGTEFQKKVWSELLQISFGETRSYEDIAIKINNPKACRAIGNANNKNKIGIIIPCHRVIGKNKKLVGYAGGLWRKEYLLKLERG